MSAPATRAETRALARRLVAGTAAKMTGRDERGHDREVWRDSYDVEDSRAKVWAPIADGTRAGGLAWIDDIVRLAREYDSMPQHRTRGRVGPLTPYGVAVFEVMLRKFLDFKTGRLEPAYDAIAGATGFARKTVVLAVKRLKAHGFLSWVRRSRLAENGRRREGQQRVQEKNAYFFILHELGRRLGDKLASRVQTRWRQLRELTRRRQATRALAGPPVPPPPAPRPKPIADPGLAAALDALRSSVRPSHR